MPGLRDVVFFVGAVIAAPVSRWKVRARGDEKRRRLPGDDVLPDAREQWTNAITIRGRPAEIWPWLAQMGCNRGGWYSYDGLDNGGSPSAQQVVAGLQRVAVGDAFPWTPADSSGFIVRALDSEHTLVLGGEPPPYSVTWTYVLEPMDDTTTRLITRCRGIPRSPLYALLTRLVAHPIHYAMQRRQLLNIKHRVEANE